MSPEGLELRELYRLQNDFLAGKGFHNKLLEDVYGDPPWETRPGDAITFYPKTAVALTNPPPAAAQTVVTFTVPFGQDGVLEELSISFVGGSFVNGSGDIIFRVLRNGHPVKNFENMISEYGSQEFPVSIGTLRMYSGDTWLIECEHIANAALNGNVLGSLRGYTYPNRGR